MTTATLTETAPITEATEATEAPVEVPEGVRPDAENLADEILMETAKKARVGRVRGSRQTRTVRGWSMGGRVD